MLCIHSSIYTKSMTQVHVNHKIQATFFYIRLWSWEHSDVLRQSFCNKTLLFTRIKYWLLSLMFLLNAYNKQGKTVTLCSLITFFFFSKRVFTENVPGLLIPSSDHYGVQSTVGNKNSNFQVDVDFNVTFSI